MSILTTGESGLFHYVFTFIKVRESVNAHTTRAGKLSKNDVFVLSISVDRVINTSKLYIFSSSLCQSISIVYKPA